MHQLFVTIGILVSGLVAYVYVPLAPQHLQQVAHATDTTWTK